MNGLEKSEHSISVYSLVFLVIQKLKYILRSTVLSLFYSLPFNKTIKVTIIIEKSVYTADNTRLRREKPKFCVLVICIG